MEKSKVYGKAKVYGKSKNVWKKQKFMEKAKVYGKTNPKLLKDTDPWNICPIYITIWHLFKCLGNDVKLMKLGAN